MPEGPKVEFGDRMETGRSEEFLLDFRLGTVNR